MGDRAEISSSSAAAPPPPNLFEPLTGTYDGYCEMLTQRFKSKWQFDEFSKEEVTDIFLQFTVCRFAFVVQKIFDGFISGSEGYDLVQQYFVGKGLSYVDEAFNILVNGEDLSRMIAEFVNFQQHVCPIFCDDNISFSDKRKFVTRTTKSQLYPYFYHYRQLYLSYVVATLGVEAEPGSNLANWFFNAMDLSLTQLDKLATSRNANEFLKIYHSSEEVGIAGVTIGGDDISSYLKGFHNILPKNVWTSVEFFCSFITACCRAWISKGDVYHSPYTALCQGSCSGKTFLALNTYVNMLLNYINLRGPDSKSLPRRTTLIADVFEGLASVSDVLLFYLSYFEALKSGLPNFTSAENKNPLESYFQFANSDEFWKQVNLKLLANRAMLSEEMSKKPGERVDDVVLSAKVIGAIKVVEALFDEKIFLFVIDEARCMLKNNAVLFFNWRTAISYLKGCNIFFVLLDTSSSLSNFQPLAYYDPSLRIHQGLQLFPPFYAYAFTGPWPVTQDHHLKVLLKGRGANLRDVSYDILHPVIYSRPHLYRLVNKIFESGIKIDESLFRNTLVGFCKTKLGTQNNEDLKISSITAILACKFGLIPLDNNTSEAIVSSHCATLVSVTPNRSAHKSVYIPEPMFVEAASDLLMSERDYNKYLHYLHTWIVNGKVGFVTSKGNLGEFVGAIYLLRIKDITRYNVINYESQFEDVKVRETVKSKGGSGSEPLSPKPYGCLSYSIPVRVGDFLRHLGCSEEFVSNSVPIDLCDALISFTSYQKVDSDLDDDVFLNAINKNYAIIAQENQEAFDILIPVLFVDSRTKGRKDTPLAYKSCVTDSQRYSSINIQCKNYASTISQAKARDLCVKQSEFVRSTIFHGKKLHRPVISILMAIGKGVTGIENNLFDVIENTFEKGEKVKDVLVYISGVPPVPGSISSATTDILKEILKIEGNATSLECQLVDLYREGYDLSQPRNKAVLASKIDKFTQYICQTIPAFQGDKFGCDFDKLRNVAEKRVKDSSTVDEVVENLKKATLGTSSRP